MLESRYGYYVQKKGHDKLHIKCWTLHAYVTLSTALSTK